MLALPFFAIAQVQWQPTGGPEGISDNYSSLFSDEKIAYYTGAFHLYSTTDGEIWKPVYDRYLAHFSFHGDTLAGLIKNYYDADSPPDSIAVSLDGGITWNELPLPDPEENIFIHEFVATKWGLFLDLGGHDWGTWDYYIWKLNDTGDGWEKFYSGGDYPAVLFSAEGEFYFLTQTNFIHVKDLQTFDTLGITFDVFDLYNYHNFFAHEDFMYFRKELSHTGQDYKFIVSYDAGQTWEDMSTAAPGPWTRLTSLNGKIYGISDFGQLSVSSDQGHTWNTAQVNTPINPYGTLAGVHDKILTKISNELLSINTASGEVKQANHKLDDGYTSNTVGYSGTLLAATGNGIHEYDLASEHWTHNLNLYKLGKINHLEEIAANDAGMIVVTKEWITDSFQISLDYGSTWTTKNFPWLLSNNRRIHRLNVLDDIIYVMSHGVLYRSGDLGDSWATVTTNGGSYFNSWPHKWNGKHLIHTADKIFVSEDEGATWSLHADFTLGILDRVITTNEVLFGFVQTPFSQPQSRIFISYDGIEWQWAHDGLTTYIGDYSNPEGADNLLLATDIFYHNGIYYLHLDHGGLFVTSDTGNIWFPINFSIGDNYDMVDSVLFHGSIGGLRKAVAPTVYGEKLTGNVYFDSNDNGTQELEEKNLPLVHVELIDPASTYPYYGAITDNEGEYILGMNAASTDTLRCNFASRYLESINPPYYIVTGESVDKDFGIHLYPDQTDLSIRCNSTFYRPGYDAYIHAAYRNEGSTEPQSFLTMLLDPRLEYVDATPAPISVNGDSIVWDLGVLPILASGQVEIKVHVPDTTPLEIYMHSIGKIWHNAEEVTPWDNAAYFNGIVLGAFDPNDKLMSPEKGLTIKQIEQGAEVQYTIRFQNTGTLPADRVKILDPIDTTIVLSSVRVLASSHPITQLRMLPTSERLLEIIFDNIALPDSATDYAGSQGYVTFSAQRRKGLKLTVPTKNQAGIYFDFNEPVLTNIKSWLPQPNIVAVDDPLLSVPELRIDPNPAQHRIFIQTPLPVQETGMINILNPEGKLVKRIAVSDLKDVHELDISTFTAGTYYVEWQSENHRFIGKLIKL